MIIDSIPLLCILLIIAATVAVGFYATRQSKSASDFFVAGRSVGVGLNAAAISGEYLSAASFMGIAGLVMKNGYDALWYPVGYAAGYLFLLLFIAGPLRRFGAYTIPDFAEGRFDSPAFRKVAVLFVLCIGFFYTMPQMKGAGLTMNTIMNWPYWVGIVIVGAVITFNVALGGMKGITLVQAFQYWVKAFAIAIPFFVIASVYGGYNKAVGTNADMPKEAPKFSKETTVKVAGKDKAPANVMSFSTLAPTMMGLPKGATIEKAYWNPKPDAGKTWSTPIIALPPQMFVLSAGKAYEDLGVTNEQLYVPFQGNTAIPAGGGILALPNPFEQSDSGTSPATPIVATPKIEFAAAAEATFARDNYVPNAPANKKWLEPYGTLTGKHGYPLLYTYSLIIALVCGTAGLPHILVRFYTNPDGRSAKRTTFWVMVLLGAFYVFTPMWGAMGRELLPALYANNKTDSVVIALPRILENKLLGEILAGITSAGAFAAFMSTFSGLLVSMSGALAHDIYGKMIKPTATTGERLTAFKIAAIVFGFISMGLGLLVESFDITLLVGWAFAIAAASYFPLLLLGAWWRGLTRYGAAAGMLLGGTLSLFAIITFMGIEKKWLPLEVSPLTKALLEQPAIWGVPFSLFVMYVVSKATAKSLPADLNSKMLRLHAPEEMGISKNYVD